MDSERSIYEYLQSFSETRSPIDFVLIYDNLGQFTAVQKNLLWDPILSNPWWCVIIAFTLNTAAYTTEFLRGAIEATPHGELEAAKACGMSPFTRLRLVVLPDATNRGWASLQR